MIFLIIQGSEQEGKSSQPLICMMFWDRVVNNLKLNIQEKNALITNDEVPTVVADEGQMIQLFQNLIGNALKFCKDPHPEYTYLQRRRRIIIFSLLRITELELRHNISTGYSRYFKDCTQKMNMEVRVSVWQSVNVLLTGTGVKSGSNQNRGKDLYFILRY